MSSSVQIIDRGWKRIERELRKANTVSVAVGVLQGSENAEGKTIAQYAADNEFGTAIIPSRPFMAMAFDNNAAAIAKDIQKQKGSILSGKRSIYSALSIIGMRHASRIQDMITKVDILPKLSKRTIERKKGSTKTLVDTGALVNSIQISVRGNTGE